MTNIKHYKEKFKDIIDINSEVNWLECRGDIDGYLLYSNVITNKFIVARRFDNHQIWYECTMMRCALITGSPVNLLSSVVNGLG